MPKKLHVALLIETSRAYGRGLLIGVTRYLQEHRHPWSLLFRPQGLGDPPPHWLDTWHGNGILARIDNRPMAEAVRATRLPTVNLRKSVLDLPFPRVGINDHIVVEMAFQHLWDSGLRHFAFCGLPRGHIWMDDRRDSFKRLIRAAGCDYDVFTGLPRRRAAPWEQEQQAIAQWLVGLPRPTGIIAGNDEWGHRILDACQRAGVSVPDEMAVIGSDNDEYLCNLSSPPLSSVDMNTEKVGYEAAALLARMMAGEPVPAEPILLPPRGVVARTSTDLLAIEDRELAGVIRYIREHACDGLRLKELLRNTNLSRHTLQRRLRATLGRSPKEEILRVQLQSAEELLTVTDLPAFTIAERCGFSDPCYFNRIFQAKVGLPPGEYRRKRGKRLVSLM